MDEPRLNLPEQTVSELSTALKRTIEDAYGYVRVRGELGKVSYHGNGHVYFDLKDDRASIAGVIWRSTAPRIKLRLEAGLEVVITGRLTTYPGRSQYQIIVETLEPAGLGALMALLEERRKKFIAEGLFDEARKQLLPYLPTVIGVITSPTGAVIRDILHRLADRFPRHVLLWPVKVQGEGSAAEVAAAIEGFNAFPEQGRTATARSAHRRPRRRLAGGSVVVQRGDRGARGRRQHDPADLRGRPRDRRDLDRFAADRRAPTPTAAAEMAVPVRADLLVDIDSLARRALACWRRNQEARRTELRSAARALPDADEVLAVPRQRLDHAAAALARALRANAQIHRVGFSRIGGRLSPQLLRTNVERRRERYTGIAHRLRASIAANIETYRTRIARQRERVIVFTQRAERAVRTLIATRLARCERDGQLLAAFSYRGVLARGFALIRDAAGQPLHSATAAVAGMPIQIEFSDGRVGARVDGASSADTPDEPTKPRPKRGGGPGQGNLF